MTAPNRTGAWLPLNLALLKITLTSMKCYIYLGYLKSLFWAIKQSSVFPINSYISAKETFQNEGETLRERAREGLSLWKSLWVYVTTASKRSPLPKSVYVKSCYNLQSLFKSIYRAKECICIGKLSAQLRRR